jgi:hypothetical protein
VLAAGLAAGAWWLLNPLLAALLALSSYRVARWSAGEAAARLALILLCASPFVVAVAGSEMSHLGAATLAMIAAAAATLATERRPVGFAALAGLALGLMTAFRPLDAVAAALPVGAILWWWCGPRLPALAATSAAGLLGSMPTLWYNTRTTGSWHTFGYTVLWGPQHSLGFHAVPFGTPLTLTRAIARTGMDLHQLNMYLLDGTLPMLLVIAVALVLGRRQLRAPDGVPFLAAGALSAFLFFYWHRDVFYGPRFLYSAVAWYVIVLARALVVLRRSGNRAGLLASTFVFATIAVGLIAITPGRMNAYRKGTPVFTLRPGREAKLAGITHARHASMRRSTPARWSRSCRPPSAIRRSTGACSRRSIRSPRFGNRACAPVSPRTRTCASARATFPRRARSRSRWIAAASTSSRRSCISTTRRSTETSCGRATSGPATPRCSSATPAGGCSATPRPRRAVRPVSSG